MARNAYVVGVGMTRFMKPGTFEGDYPELVAEAVRAALADADIPYDDVETAHVGYVYGPTTSGQRSLYEVGRTGIPVTNVTNACSTGSTALMLARNAVISGQNDIVLAVGFEKMERGSLSMTVADRLHPMDKHVERIEELYGHAPSPMAPQMWARAAQLHMQRFESTPEQFAAVAEKNHRHSANNPYAQFQDVYTIDEIMASPLVEAPLTRLQCSPTSDGAAAAVVVSEDVVERLGLEDQAVLIAGQAMVTDLSDPAESDAFTLVGADMSRAAAKQAYEEAGFDVDDVQVIELHDCFSPNEVLTYEALGMCEEGEGGLLVTEGATTYGGRWLVNGSGGLISKGHPLGATGLAQCTELVWQLRGKAEGRQLEGAKRALQHNIGLGGAAVVTLYQGPGLHAAA